MMNPFLRFAKKSKKANDQINGENAPEELF